MKAQEVLLLPVDTQETQEAVMNVAGHAGMLLMKKEPGTLSHQLQVGSLMAEAMIESGFEPDSDEVTHARISGGLHDLGKYHPELLTHVTSPQAWSPEFRADFRDAHCRHGETFISMTPHALGWAKFAKLAAKVARHHHSEIPEDYAQLDTQKTPFESTVWGYVDLLQPFDRAQAVGSATRSYVKNRERGQMTAQRVLDIALGGREEKRLPMINGVEVNFIPYLERRLGL